MQMIQLSPFHWCYMYELTESSISSPYPPKQNKILCPESSWRGLVRPRNHFPDYAANKLLKISCSATCTLERSISNPLGDLLNSNLIQHRLNLNPKVLNVGGGRSPTRPLEKIYFPFCKTGILNPLWIRENVLQNHIQKCYLISFNAKAYHCCPNFYQRNKRLLFIT